MTEILILVGAFVVIAEIAIIVRNNCEKAAAMAVANAASAATNQRMLEATARWMRDHQDRGKPPKMICGAAPAGFDHDEQVLCVLPGMALMELRAVRHTISRGRSAYGGPTIRLARGVSFRLGGSSSAGRSVSESVDELREIDNGTLILTTKRLAFLGSLRTNNSSLDNLISVTDAGGGIQVHRERKQNAQTYVFTSPLYVDGLEITGPMILLAIEMAKFAQTVNALEAAPPPAQAQVQVQWNESPFHEDRGNPLQCGSLHE